METDLLNVVTVATEQQTPSSSEVVVGTDTQKQTTPAPITNPPAQPAVTTTQSATNGPDLTTQFSKTVDDAKIKVLQEAALNDKKFIDDFEKQLKDATLKLAQVEQEKAEAEKARVELVKKNVEYEKELTETRRKLNEFQQMEDKWANKQKAREYHYNGVKNVMMCMGITEPMCIPLLYLLFPIALIFFLIKSIVTATFGNLLCGAVDKDRPKAMKGFLWTILALFTAAVLVAVIWLIYTNFIM